VRIRALAHTGFERRAERLQGGTTRALSCGMTKRIGPMMQAVQDYVARHPGCSKLEVARYAVARNPYARDMGAIYGPVNRALDAGLIEDRHIPGCSRGRYYLYVVKGGGCTFETTDAGDRVRSLNDGDYGTVTAVRRDDTATVSWDRGHESDVALDLLRHLEPGDQQ
jgi:hypothetical protein